MFGSSALTDLVAGEKLQNEQNVLVEVGELHCHFWPLTAWCSSLLAQDISRGRSAGMATWLLPDRWGWKNLNYNHLGLTVILQIQQQTRPQLRHLFFGTPSIAVRPEGLSGLLTLRIIEKCPFWGKSTKVELYCQVLWIQSVFFCADQHPDLISHYRHWPVAWRLWPSSPPGA